MPNFTFTTNGVQIIGCERSLCSLSELPLELLIEILKEVEWKDILHIRKTSKRLSEVSRTRALWLNLFYRYTASDAAQSIQLERPIDTYASHELEYLLLRWKSAEIGWITDDGVPARERRIPTEKAETKHLVKGGRWLLIATSTGSVIYYDLESSTNIGTLLTPSKFGHEESVLQTLMSVDIDESSPTLTFNLALSFMGDKFLDDWGDVNNDPPLEPVRMIKIWRIALVLDDKQHGAGLSAKYLASFPHHPFVSDLYSLSLLGSHVAFTVFCSEDNKEYSIVVDWARANGTSSKYPKRILSQPNGSRSIYLLPNNRLFIVDLYDIFIYDYSAIEERITGDDLFSTPTMPLWEVELEDIGHELISKPFISCDSHTTRFVCVAGNALHGIVIDDDSKPGGQPQIVKLMDIPFPFDRRRPPCLGYRQAVSTTGASEAFLMRYSWPGEEGHEDRLPTFLTKIYSFCPQYPNFGPLMDEGSGRVVFSSRVDSHQIVLDVALLYK
ncbi:hypothetical protein BDZ97DRAFT_2056242 [Flammula alnicola]|nr:hypothetical protein BDZ97DRAFT_2056242 [Flammula alnicola]